MDTTTRREERLAQEQEKFTEDLRNTAQAADTFSESGAEQPAAQGQELKQAMQAAGEFLQSAAEQIQEQIAAGAKKTDEMIREKPYQAVGIALAAGFLAGYLIKRK
jgi:ElaB/YqjD/DUF883 family membrane-anchored ribosome-binding protein